MGQIISQELARIQSLLDGELHDVAVAKALEHLGAPGFPRKLLPEARLYSDYLPRAAEVQPTQRQRALHFLWDAFDKLPLSVIADFAIPFRRMIAERLFRSCGANFIADEGVRFNFGMLLDVGDDVFLNRGVFLDTKGGVSLGDAVCLTEWVAVFTHAHSEARHVERTYAPVSLEPYVKVYSDAIILPGVTVGAEAIIGARSLVHRDVDPGEVVAGIPAHPVRERATEGRHDAELEHYWFAERAFQTDARRARALQA
jgi:acetyltransferase-like isoleucine patch superfamily enzyme